MHDLVHDLAQFVAGSECLSFTSEEIRFILDGVRHVSFHNQFIIQLPEGWNTLHNGKKLRTILTSTGTLDCTFTDISLTFRYVRVLVFKDMKHLRYPTVWWNHRNLADSFSRLFNLQFLVLRSYLIEKLPKGGFKNFINLRHLGLDCKRLVVLLDKWIGRLTSLRYLLIKRARKLTSLSEGFQRLTNLQVLKIYSCEELVLLSPGLRHLPALEKLSIVDCENLQFRDDNFQGLTSPKSLYLNDLPLLKSLSMGLQCAAPTLTYFTVRPCSKLTTRSVSLENFTCLQSLEIVGCCNLLCLPEGIQILTTLQLLRMSGCPDLRRRYSKDGGELWPHISHTHPLH